MQLEWFMSKDALLETYLNHVPYGRNVEGIEAASLAYFGHRSNALSADEVATLLAVPQNPNRRYPKADNLKRLEAGRNEIAAFLLEEEAMALGGQGSRIPAADLLAQIRGTTVPERLTPMPRYAPHLAYWLRESHPGQQRFYTTLDESVQGIAERQMAAKSSHLRRQGIDHGVSIVIDHESAEVRAMVGSFDYWGGQRGSQIPMFSVPRSPGSALKPYIYRTSCPGYSGDLSRIRPQEFRWFVFGFGLC